MRRMLLVLSAAALMAVLVAGPVAAQAEPERFPINESFEGETNNECNGQGIRVTGEIKGFAEVVTTPSGETLVKLHAVSIGEAVDEQGNTYPFRTISNEEYLGDFVEGGPATLNLTQMVVTPGPEDNYFIQYAVHISPDGETVVDNFRIDCRG